LIVAPGHADPYRAIDRQPDPAQYVTFLERRGSTLSQVRLRRRFLRFCRIRPGWHVLEVGSGTGVLSRDVAAVVGRRGRVVGVDPSRVFVAAARRLAREHGLDGRIRFRVGDGARLPFPANRFDCALAVTVLLHVPNARAIVGELARVTKPGGVVGIQDQDLGSLVLDHPDRALTRRILDGVAARTVVDPWSGRTLVRQLRAAGLTRIRLTTDVFQDTTLTSFTRSMLERRANNAVRFGLTSSRAAARWLETVERSAAEGRFVFTLNYYGAAGIKPRNGGSA
jgi:ubiquinone/menaquinone biosynthesis C-methylase UbiE